jgi:hypothetical protein
MSRVDLAVGGTNTKGISGMYCRFILITGHHNIDLVVGIA